MKTDTVNVVLTLGGGIGEGITPPPPQRLTLPASYLDPLNPTASVQQGAIHASSVTLQVPATDLAATNTPPISLEQLTIGIGITAQGWQQRTRAVTDPRLGAMKNRQVLPTTDFGLTPLLLPDPAAYETVYMGEDPEMGFIQVKCFGFPRRGARTCRVMAEHTPYLTISVELGEDRLHEWRATLLAARKVAAGLLR